MPQAVSYRPQADNSLTPLSEQATAALADRAGLTVYMLRVDTLTDQLTRAAAVDAHLNCKPHPGVPSPLEQVAATLGPDAARRYKTAWHRAVTSHGPITYTTPVMYLECPEDRHIDEFPGSPITH
jgi:hypothetical protein